MTTGLSTPAPNVRDLLARAPAHLRERWDAQGVPDGAEDSTPAQVAEQVRRVQSVNRRSRWERRLPARYRDVTLTDLTPEQDQGRVGQWLDHRSLVLLLAGHPGTGKTHAAYAVGNAAVYRDDPLWAVAYTAADLNAALRPGGEREAYREASECGLLILDDLGREQVTEWTIEQLHRVLDVRNRERRRTVVTTNLPYDDRGFSWDRAPAGSPPPPNLLGRYGSPLLDRLMDDAAVVALRGESRRAPAPW